MTETARIIWENFQVRKSKKEKAAFRAWLCGQLTEAGYQPKVERAKGFASSNNVVVGDPEKAKVLFTAHYDTCAVLPFPNFITPRNMVFYLLYQLLVVAFFFVVAALVAFGSGWLFEWMGLPQEGSVLAFNAPLIFCIWWMIDGKANRHTANDNTSGVLTLVETALALPAEDRDKVCFLFFDNEEKGMLGSLGFGRKHKEVKRDKLAVNFDCVADGDYIQFYPAKALKREVQTLTRLEDAFQGCGDKRVEVVRGFGFYPSDNGSFCRGVGVCALKYRPLIGYYMDRIHTARDTVLEEENIRLLRDGALRFAAEC